MKTPKAVSRVVGVVRGAAVVSRVVAETIGTIGVGVGIILKLWDMASRNLGLSTFDPLWINDAATLFLVSGAFVFIARTQVHLGFTGLFHGFHMEKTARRVDLVTRPLISLLMVFLLIQGIRLISTQIHLGGNYSAEISLPVWGFYALAPFMYLLCALQWLAPPAKTDAAPVGSVPEGVDPLDAATALAAGRASDTAESRRA